jgi:hypothetical protein
MAFQIIDLALFAKIQGLLEGVTPANLEELKPDHPIPEGAMVHGVMSPTLKALLWVRNQAIMAAYKEYEAVAKTQKQTMGDLIELLDAQRTYHAEADSWHRLFRHVLRTEYPDIKSDVVTYGPNFEVYETKAGEGAGLSVILLSGQIVH